MSLNTNVLPKPLRYPTRRKATRRQQSLYRSTLCKTASMANPDIYFSFCDYVQEDQKEDIQKEVGIFLGNINKITSKTFKGKVCGVGPAPFDVFECTVSMTDMHFVENKIDSMLDSKCVTKACIVSLDGNVWAKSDGFEVDKDEITRLVSGFGNENVLTDAGVTLDGQRYIYLSENERVVRAKLGKVGVHCMKTQAAAVVSLYEDPIQPQQAASVVELVADHLGSWETKQEGTTQKN